MSVMARYSGICPSVATAGSPAMSSATAALTLEHITFHPTDPRQETAA